MECVTGGGCAEVVGGSGWLTSNAFSIRLRMTSGYLAFAGLWRLDHLREGSMKVLQNKKKLA
jgi:hypothetical protein